MTIQQLFKLAMKRGLPELLDMPPGLVLNVGAGNSLIPDTTALDWPWDGDQDDIPYQAATVAGIHAYHFMEHLHNPIRFLRDASRVLQPGGILQIGVPHYSGQMAFQDLDHHSFYTTETWQKLFNNPYYLKHGPWHFHIHFNAVMFIVERNPILLTQLVRT